MAARMDYQVDNRDLTTTWLHPLNAGGYIEVDPFELLSNTLENAGFPEGLGEFIGNYFKATCEMEGDDDRADTSVKDRLVDMLASYHLKG